MVANLTLPQPAAVGDEWGNALNTAVQAVNADVETTKGRQIATGLGLTGGGTLAADRTLAVDFAASGAVSATKAVRADDSRLSDARTPTGHTHTKAQVTDFAHTHVKADVTDFAHTHPQSEVTNLVTDLAAKVPTSRLVSSGSGLTGGGALTSDRTLAVDFATATPLPVDLAAAAVGTAVKPAREDHKHLLPAAIPRGVLSQTTTGAASATIGDVFYGTTAAITTATGRRVRLTCSGAFTPPSPNTGVLFTFMRAINGAAGVTVGPAFYCVAPNAFQNGFTFTFNEVVPAGSIVYYVRMQGHYANGSVLSAGAQFLVEDIGL